VDGTGQVIAILDTGVDKTHPFLANKVVAEACFSTTLAGRSVTT
jgi:subtilisin family serine protease